MLIYISHHQTVRNSQGQKIYLKVSRKVSRKGNEKQFQLVIF